MKKVYSFYWDCGRMGIVEGLFVADDATVKQAIGNRVYFGEILGKHSEVYGTLEENDLQELSDNPDVVAFVEEHASIGYNPLHYITIDCEICGEVLEEYGTSYKDDVVERCKDCDCPFKDNSHLLDEEEDDDE